VAMLSTASVFCRTIDVRLELMNAGPLLLALLPFLILSAPVRAQNASYIFGRVLDPSQAVVPGAGITVVNQETGFRRVTDTGPDGAYTVGSLHAGLYKITVRKEGFV